MSRTNAVTENNGTDDGKEKTEVAIIKQQGQQQ
jgi:hypothetical protein